MLFGEKCWDRIEITAFEAVFKISRKLVGSVTGSKSQNSEPVNGSETGGSAD